MQHQPGQKRLRCAFAEETSGETIQVRDAKSVKRRLSFMAGPLNIEWAAQMHQ